MAVPVLMLFLLVQQLRWLLYRCSESVAAAVIMADGQIAQCMSGVVSPIHVFNCLRFANPAEAEWRPELDD